MPEPPPVRAERLAEADIVEHRSNVEQLRIEAQTTVAALQAPEPVHPAGVIVDQLIGGIAYQLGGLSGELCVWHGHARGERLSVTGATIQTGRLGQGHKRSFQAGQAPRHRPKG